MRELDLSKIDCDTIGTNLSYLARPSGIHIFTCGWMIRKMRRELVNRTACALHRFAALPLEGCFNPRMIGKYCLDAFERDEKIPALPDDYSIYEHGWIIAGAGPGALQVAMSLGYDEVIYCGLDLNVAKGLHFYPEAVYGKTRRSRPSPERIRQASEKKAYLVQTEFFRQFEPELRKRGIKVYNTSLRSAETTFEKRKFGSFWS